MDLQEIWEFIARDDVDAADRDDEPPLAAVSQAA
jgi:hypothetical protein